MTSYFPLQWQMKTLWFSYFALWQIIDDIFYSHSRAQFFLYDKDKNEIMQHKPVFTVICE